MENLHNIVDLNTNKKWAKFKKDIINDETYILDIMMYYVFEYYLLNYAKANNNNNTYYKSINDTINYEIIKKDYIYKTGDIIRIGKYIFIMNLYYGKLSIYTIYKYRNNNEFIMIYSGTYNINKQNKLIDSVNYNFYNFMNYYSSKNKYFYKCKDNKIYYNYWDEKKINMKIDDYINLQDTKYINIVEINLISIFFGKHLMILIISSLIQNKKYNVNMSSNKLKPNYFLPREIWDIIYYDYF